jgi:hypothetical protein
MTSFSLSDFLNFLFCLKISIDVNILRIFEIFSEYFSTTGKKIDEKNFAGGSDNFSRKNFKNSVKRVI